MHAKRERERERMKMSVVGRIKEKNERGWKKKKAKEARLVKKKLKKPHLVFVCAYVSTCSSLFPI